MTQKKRNNKKHNKYKTLFKKLYGLSIVDHPTEILALCNCGLENGLSQEKVIEAFETFGEIQNVLLVPGRNYTLIKFSSVEASSTAFDNAPSEIIPSVITYVAYIDELPSPCHLGMNFEAPPGLIVLEDFITPEEEEKLLKLVQMDLCTSSLKHRTVKHYGYEFSYSENRANIPTTPMLSEFDFLWTRLAKTSGLQFEPDQCTVNRYNPGDGIPRHVDTHSAFTELIVSLSLQSSICMDWKEDGTGEVHCVVLPRWSLCVMAEESRYKWTHSIITRKSDIVQGKLGGLTTIPRLERTSLTFRCRRQGECSCSYPSLCDSAQERLKKEAKGVTSDSAAEFEKTCVHEVYDQIADHFSETRHKPWPNVVEFLQSFEEGSLILDVGCGNGKYLNTVNAGSIAIGCDRSESLLELCQARGSFVFTCDCLQIPVRDGAFDGCICIAVIHHLSTQERRLKALEELVRVLRPGGRALIYVWSKNQESDKAKSSYLKQRKKTKEVEAPTENLFASSGNISLPVHTNRTNFNHADMFVPWQKKNNAGENAAPTFLRYYHVFEENELFEMAESLSTADCDKYYYDQGNWCIIIRKR